MKEKNKKSLSRLITAVENFPMSLFPLIREVKQGINIKMPYSKLKRPIELFDKRIDNFYERIEQCRGERINGHDDIDVYLTYVELYLGDINKALYRVKEGASYQEYKKIMKFLNSEHIKVCKKTELLLEKIVSSRVE